LAVLIDRTPLAARDAEDRDLRRIDDRREERAADAAEARDGEYAALHLVGLELPFAGPRAQLAELGGDLVHVLAVRIPNHRDDEPVLRVHGEPEMGVPLHDQALTVL